MCKLDWILNSSSFLKCLAATPQTNISNFAALEISLEGTMPGPAHYQMAARLQGLERWGHISQLMKVPPVIWSLTNTRDPKSNSPGREAADT